MNGDQTYKVFSAVFGDILAGTSVLRPSPIEVLGPILANVVVVRQLWKPAACLLLPDPSARPCCYMALQEVGRPTPPDISSDSSRPPSSTLDWFPNSRQSSSERM